MCMFLIIYQNDTFTMLMLKIYETKRQTFFLHQHMLVLHCKDWLFLPTPSSPALFQKYYLFSLPLRLYLPLSLPSFLFSMCLLFYFLTLISFHPFFYLYLLKFKNILPPPPPSSPRCWWLCCLHLPPSLQTLQNYWFLILWTVNRCKTELNILLPT